MIKEHTMQGQETYIGAAPQQQVRPSFYLKPMSRKRKITKCIRDEDGFRMEEVEIEEDGFFVQCYKGHSVFINSMQELQRLNLAGMVPLLVEGEDKPVGYMPSPLDKKEK
jgi:hypothetical protein